MVKTFLQGAHKLIRIPSAPGSGITETLGGGATSTAYTHPSRSIAGDISAPYTYTSLFLITQVTMIGKSHTVRSEDVILPSLALAVWR